MPIRSAAVGSSTAPTVHAITTRQCMAYAAGIGDTNPRYFDDAADTPIVAHPALCGSLEWSVTLAVRALDALGLTDDEGRRIVHASQDSTFHRAIRPGDRLRTTATIVAIRAIAPGTLLTTKFATVDDATNAPVVTSYSGSIVRGVAVEGDDAACEDVPAIQMHDGALTMPGSVVLAVPEEAAHVYTECANIWNPIHTERAVALGAGLPDIILHGTYTWAIAAREIIDRCADGDPTRLRRLSGRFSAMIIPGSSVAMQYGDPSGDPPAVPFTVRNAQGDPAISHGNAVLAL